MEVKSKKRGEQLHWGTVCDDEFDMLDANVACRTLGLGTASRVFTNAKFGQGSRSVGVTSSCVCLLVNYWLLAKLI